MSTDTEMFGPVAAHYDATQQSLTMTLPTSWEFDEACVRGHDQAAAWADQLGWDSARAVCDYPAGAWCPTEGFDVFVYVLA